MTDRRLRLLKQLARIPQHIKEAENLTGEAQTMTFYNTVVSRYKIDERLFPTYHVPAPLP